jgi:uncharacterized membrane protein
MALLVLVAVLAVILGAISVYHGIRTYAFAVEWERRYVKLRELEQKMASDLNITLEE